MDCISLRRKCRVCLEEAVPGVSLFLHPATSSGSHTIAQIIKHCTGVKVSEFDDLPRQVCNECANLANMALYFWQKCESSDAKLKNCLLNESLSFKDKDFNLMGLSDLGDSLFYENMSSESLFPSFGSFFPKQYEENLPKCNNKQIVNDVAIGVSYHCHLCQNTYDCCRDLVDHVVSSHTPAIALSHLHSSVTCDLCGGLFSSKFECEKHKSTHEVFNIGETISCSFCIELFSEHKSHQKHIDTHVETSRHKCDSCQCYFGTDLHLMKHNKVSHVDSREDRELTIDSDILKNQMCLMDDSYSFLNNALDLNADDLIQNIDETNLNGSFISHDVDSAQYITDYDANKVLSEVLECANPVKLYPSCKSKREMLDEFEINDNILLDGDEVWKSKKRKIRPNGESTPIRTREYSFKCSRCPKLFVRLVTLEKHEARDKCKKDILCPECGKIFYKPSALKKHKLSHRPKPNQKHRCSICAAEFSKSNHLKYHMKAHTEIVSSNPSVKQSLLCTLCGKSSSTQSNLLVHMRRHTKTATDVCKICGKGYPRNSDLKLHMRQHTEEQPFECRTCHKCFKRSDALTVHMRTHTGERPYCCSNCNKGFKQKCDLRTHIVKESCLKKKENVNQIQKNTRESIENPVKIVEKIKAQSSKSLRQKIKKIQKDSNKNLVQKVKKMKEQSNRSPVQKVKKVKKDSNKRPIQQIKKNYQVSNESLVQKVMKIIHESNPGQVQQTSPVQNVKEIKTKFEKNQKEKTLWVVPLQFNTGLCNTEVPG